MTSFPLSMLRSVHNNIITTWYQVLPLVTCRLNSGRRFFSTRACSSLWLTRKRLPIVTESWCNMTVNISLTSLNLFQYVMVDGVNIDWTQWNNGWRILFWYSCCQACCNILGGGLCALCVVLQLEYKFFTVILELHKVVIKHWTPYVVNFW